MISIIGLGFVFFKNWIELIYYKLLQNKFLIKI